MGVKIGFPEKGAAGAKENIGKFIVADISGTNREIKWNYRMKINILKVPEHSKNSERHLIIPENRVNLYIKHKKTWVMVIQTESG